MRKLLTDKQIKLYQKLILKGSARLKKKAERIIDNDIYRRHGIKTSGYLVREK